MLKTVIPVWLSVAAAAVLVGLLTARGDYFGWLAIVMAAGIVLTFCIQLAIVEKEGLVTRVMVAMSGAIVILGVASLALSVVALT